MYLQSDFHYINATQSAPLGHHGNRRLVLCAHSSATSATKLWLERIWAASEAWGSNGVWGVFSPTIPTIPTTRIQLPRPYSENVHKHSIKMTWPCWGLSGLIRKNERWNNVSGYMNHAMIMQGVDSRGAVWNLCMERNCEYIEVEVLIGYGYCWEPDETLCGTDTYSPVWIIIGFQCSICVLDICKDLHNLWSFRTFCLYLLRK